MSTVVRAQRTWLFAPRVWSASWPATGRRAICFCLCHIATRGTSFYLTHAFMHKLQKVTGLWEKRILLSHIYWPNSDEISYWSSALKYEDCFFMICDATKLDCYWCVGRVGSLGVRSWQTPDERDWVGFWNVGWFEQIEVAIDPKMFC